MHASMTLGDFTFRVGLVDAAPGSPRTMMADTDHRVVGYFGASFLGIGSLVAAAAFFVPPIGLTSDEDLDRDRMYMMQAYLEASAEREREQKKQRAEAEKEASESGGEGERAQGSEGQMGNELAKQTGNRAGIKGPKHNPDPHLAKARALEEAQTFGMLSIMTGDPLAPTSPWGRETSLGRDESSAEGNMWGEEIGLSFGGGLGLSGGGDGGGGYGKGIGLGNIGFGFGTTLGNDGGFGRGPGRLTGTRKAKGAPTVRSPNTIVSGRLPPEVVQRIVRQNYGRFRMCYQNGLSRNPNLEGRVAVRFVIGRDGAVSNVSKGSSDLPDSSVVGCVVSAFYGLSFPVPENGIVSVVYPIMFSPG
jgi:hypothetical protein